MFQNLPKDSYESAVLLLQTCELSNLEINCYETHAIKQNVLFAGYFSIQFRQKPKTLLFFNPIFRSLHIIKKSIL